MASTTNFEREAVQNPQQSVIRAGVIGMGFIGEVHVRAIRAAGGSVDVVAAATIQEAQAAAKKLLIPRALTIEEMISDSEIDVIHVCTPNIFHAELAEKVIRARKHIVCEKPLAVSVEEAKCLTNLAKEFGVVASIPYIYRYYPSVRDTRTRARNLKEPFNLLHGYYLQDWLSRETTVNWRIDSEFSGPSRAFGDIGVHWCDVVEWVTGHRITFLNAQMMRVFNSRGTDANVDTEDGATIIFKTDKGAHGSLVLSQVSAGRKNKLWFSLESPSESFVFDQESPDQLWIGGLATNQISMRGVFEESLEAKTYSFLPAGHPQGYQDCFNAFVNDSYRAIAGIVVDGLPTFEDGLRSSNLTEAVIQSAKSGEWVGVN
jgi:predicted dehydrogenase